MYIATNSFLQCYKIISKLEEYKIFKKNNNLNVSEMYYNHCLSNVIFFIPIRFLSIH